MKNFVKVASLVATLALAACQTNPSTTFAPKADPVNSRNVQNSDGQIWLSGDYGTTNGTDKLCWQTGYYPDGNPIPGCDAMPEKNVTIDKSRLNFDAQTLFGFDQATLRPEGQAMLSRLASALNSVAYKDAIVVGHTDSWGSDAYNDRLSLRRAEAVKAYLVGQGVAADKIVTKGMGERELIVDPKTCKGTKAARQACEQPNRRVTVDIEGVVVPANQVNKWRDTLNAVGVNVKK